MQSKHRALTIRIAVGLPEEYLEFAAETVVYLRDRGVIEKMTKSPWEQRTGEKPKLAHLRVGVALYTISQFGRNLCWIQRGYGQACP